MKINFINFVKGVIMLFIGLCSLVTLGQNPQNPDAVSSISLAPNISGLNVGDIVHVPVTITTATGPNKPIVSANIYIDYNQNVLSPLGPDGFNPLYGSITYNPYFGTNLLFILWESPTPVSYTHLTLPTILRV